MTPRTTARAAGAAVALAGVLWGVSGTVVKGVLNQGVPPLALLQGRLLSAGVLLLGGLLVFAPRLLLPRARDLPLLAAWALGGFLCVQASYLWAVSLGPVALAIFLQYTAPILTALWARLATRERLAAGLATSILVCLAGLGGLVFGGGVHAPVPALAVAAGLLSSVAGALNSILGKRALARVPLPTVLCVGLWSAFAASCAFASPGETLRILLPAHARALAFIAIGATVLPFLLFLWGLARLTPTTAILLSMLEPVVGAVVAWGVLGEAMEPAQVAGAAVVLAGVALAQRGVADRGELLGRDRPGASALGSPPP